MTQLGLEPKTTFPLHYRGYQVIRGRGRVYAVPDHLDPDDLDDRDLFEIHPAVLSGSVLEEVKARIDALALAPEEPQFVCSHEGYNLVRHRGVHYGVPAKVDQVDMDLAEDRQRAGVIEGDSREEVEARIRRDLDAVPVEFAGWLPVFKEAGNCGRHPQFKHTADPPPGYRFTVSSPARLPGLSLLDRAVGGLGNLIAWLISCSWWVVRPFVGLVEGGPGMTVRGRLWAFASMVRLTGQLLLRGARLFPILRFIRTRHHRSQVLLANAHDLVFLTSMPYTYGQQPWVIEIEDPTTLFHPLIHNGHTSTLSIADSPYFPIVKTLLESDQCKGILTHMKSTARLVSTLFRSDTILDKIYYAPLGVKLPVRWQRHEDTLENEPLNLLFTNSWCQVPVNFLVRGGLDVLEAFGILHERYPHLRLTLRSDMPGLDRYYQRIMERGWVRVIDRILSAEEMDALLAESHIFLLPAARVHIVSLLQAMSYGLAVVTSDGWGIEEYVEHERNGLIVKGRYGKVSWADEEAGMLREDYEPMHTSDAQVVRGIVDAVSRLVEDRALRKRLGQTARRDVASNFSLESWNDALKQLFDRAMATDGEHKVSGAA
jgi:glycosyltransferase involved in cell wall biosynthesis